MRGVDDRSRRYSFLVCAPKLPLHSSDPFQQIYSSCPFALLVFFAFCRHFLLTFTVTPNKPVVVVRVLQVTHREATLPHMGKFYPPRLRRSSSESSCSSWYLRRSSSELDSSRSVRSSLPSSSALRSSLSRCSKKRLVSELPFAATQELYLLRNSAIHR